MATNRTTDKKPPTNSVPTSAKEWKKNANSGGPLVVPSGNTAMVRNPGMQVFLAEGLVPNSLMGPIQAALNTGKAPTIQSYGDITSDMMADMLKMTDAVCVYCVIEPKLTSNRDAAGNIIDVDDRDEELLYVDEVSIEDKMFIFQWAVGGTRDLESFRKSSAEGLGGLPAVPESGSTT